MDGDASSCSLEDIKLGLIQYGYTDTAQATRMFQQIDTDHSGDISFEEFPALYVVFSFLFSLACSFSFFKIRTFFLLFFSPFITLFSLLFALY